MIINYTGISGSRVAYLAAAEFENKGNCLIVVSKGLQANRLKEDLAFFMPETKIYVMPEEEDMRILYEARNRESQIERIKAIQGLVDDKEQKVVIAPISAVLRPTISKSRYVETMQELSLGMRIDPASLRAKLVSAGYTYASVVESAGEFTTRGGIIDVFSPSAEYPIRIEFFDDEIDSIRYYDPATQRSLENIKSITIGPAAEYVPSDEEKAVAIKKLRKDDEKVAELFEQGSDVQIYADFIDYFDIDKHYLWEYLENGVSYVVDPNRIVQDIPEFENKDDFRKIYDTDCILITPFPETIKNVDKLDKVINSRSRQVASFNGQLELFAKELSSLAKAGYSIKIVGTNDERLSNIREYVEIAEVYGDISYLLGNLSAGMVMDDDKICYITEADIFPQTRKKLPKRKKKKSKDSIEFSDLHKGDYVVHETHGIGRFEGIKTMTADGDTRDYLVIRYAGSDVLYIPTEQLDIIQKYIGSGGGAPSLSRLSGGSWKRARERAKKSIMEIAEDLVKLYAEREACGGYAFSQDTVWQAEFEDAFPYTETDDQLRATEEIKEDMQKALPMDRLLCGDVGYGKTEVAARAIFKCLSEGKQAAILAPTTLLVNQHYHNLLERFEGFPFEIGELSRFKSAAKQKEVVKGLADGTVDLVIGTHRLLSDDVKFKDLGLLVIDEEQRFGVQHKEKIKKLRNNIDVLTLSATPIPRTLNMSLTGIKDISTIEEPPGDRLPVQTYVTPYEEELLKSVIERELARGGQVFVVNNRITGIKTIAAAIERLVPDVRVAIGHGRMSEEALENTMMDFIDGNIDVLVATTIIENGIDIPNANTMVILNADKLGLAQLYQLRGRVGRSNRLAYAYLMYQPQKVLTELATKRLVAIREFTEFGAGFKLAMRDLELRGAGNVLGEAQSGHIEGIGYELYCKEIDRAVRQLKGENVTETRADINIEMTVDASIPSSYIEDETLRLQAYKKIVSIACEEDAADISDELLDRYGDLPDKTENLIRVAEIRAAAERIGIETISERGTRIVLRFAEKNNVNAYMLVIAKEEIGDSLTIMSGKLPGLSLFTGKKQALDKLLRLMKSLTNALDSSQEVQK